MIVFIDNYDSFSYNLVQYLGQLGCQPGQRLKVVRNDAVSLATLQQWQPEAIVLSPGPCTPNEAGICLDVVGHFLGSVPILGVCLGMQALAVALGGQVVRAKTVMHGKMSKVYHRGKNLFAGVASPCLSTRYHSLVVADLPAQVTVSAWTGTADAVDEIMGIDVEHVGGCGAYGVQFHPESIRSHSGHKIIKNFLAKVDPLFK